MTELLEELLLVAVGALLVGAALAAALRSSVRQRGHARAVERFAAGQGRDPNAYPIGAHKSFAQNFRLIAAAALGFGVVVVLLNTVAG